MVPLAPRYDGLIRELADALDDREDSMAETCRRVAAVAESVGLFRPSYSHLRRFLTEKRRREEAARMRRRELRQIAADVYLDAMRGYRVDRYELAERIREAEHLKARGSEPQAH
jgi:hypothetical protein